MQKVIFVIGGTGSGKTYFINHHFDGEDLVKSDIYDFQERAYEDAGYGKNAPVPYAAGFLCLYNAQKMHIQDIVDKLKDGKNVIAEQTFFKAKRRITYLDKIRETAGDVRIEVYVMKPDDERWEKNCEERNIKTYTFYKRQMEENFEFPNPAEGFDAIYEVNGEDIRLRMDPPEYEIIEKARKELKEEEQQVREKEEQAREEEERKRKRKELIQSMNTRPFWHYCEVCGKKEFITADEAHENGWDYPPYIGYFGMLGPRTCGDCLLKDTLYWKIRLSCKIPIVIESNLSEEELVIWRRIKAEPQSLLEDPLSE